MGFSSLLMFFHDIAEGSDVQFTLIEEARLKLIEEEARLQLIEEEAAQYKLIEEARSKLIEEKARLKLMEEARLKLIEEKFEDFLLVLRVSVHCSSQD